MPRYMRRMYSDLTNGLPFMKMHGLGNDFVVLDAREKVRKNSTLDARRIWMLVSQPGMRYENDSAPIIGTSSNAHFPLGNEFFVARDGPFTL